MAGRLAGRIWPAPTYIGCHTTYIECIFIYLGAFSLLWEGGFSFNFLRFDRGDVPANDLHTSARGTRGASMAECPRCRFAYLGNSSLAHRGVAHFQLVDIRFFTKMVQDGNYFTWKTDIHPKISKFQKFSALARLVGKILV